MENKKTSFTIYCDESCHLEHDKINKPMLLGCIWAESDKAKRCTQILKRLKQEFGLTGELKWTKVSPENVGFYLAIVEWFFSEDDLRFRAIIVPDKGKLEHARFNQEHDDFYYKLYFWLLNKIISPDCVYNIFLDVKDTRSRFKVRKLREFLCFDKYDFTGEMIPQLRSLRSHEVELMQLADFMLGAVSYRNRGLKSSTAKLAVVKRIESHCGYKLTESTSIFEKKFNLFVWRGWRMH